MSECMRAYMYFLTKKIVESIYSHILFARENYPDLNVCVCVCVFIKSVNINVVNGYFNDAMPFCSFI